MASVTGWHRKSLIRALNRSEVLGEQRPRRGRPRAYGVEIAVALRTLWQASGQVGARLLQPQIPEQLAKLRGWHELEVGPEVEGLLLRASVSTIHRLLPASPRRALRGPSPARRLQGEIPVPFDRMLVAQAREESLTLVTADPRLERYEVELLPASS